MTELDNLTIIDQTRPDQTTYDFLYDKEDYLQPHRLNTNHLEDKALSFRVINGSYVLPFPDSVEDGSGMFSNDGLYVKGSSLWNGGIYTADYASLSAIADKRRLDLSRVPRKNQTVIFAGTLLNIWGHFITDCMRLIWFLRSQECTEKFSGLQVIYIPDAMFKMSGNYKRFLEIMGIDTSRMIPVTELTFYDKVILPDECFFLRKDGERFFTREYVVQHRKGFRRYKRKTYNVRQDILFLLTLQERKSFRRGQAGKIFCLQRLRDKQPGDALTR